MSSNRTVYHVVPNASGEKWLMTQEGTDSTRDEFATKAEAVEAAKQRARKQEPSQVKVHKGRRQLGIREHLRRRSDAHPELAGDR